jgi:hypothetical protein
VYDLRVRRLWLLPIAAVAGLLVWFASGRRDSPPGPPSSAPAALPGEPAFLGSARCRSCHEDAYLRWRETRHARSFRPAPEATGAFDGAPVDGGGFLAFPKREGSERVVKVEPKDNRSPGNHRVTAVVGGASEEAGLFTDARGAWRLLPIAWNPRRKGWDATHEVLAAITGEPAPREGFDARQIIFNGSCAPCHLTRWDAGFSVAPDGGDTFSSRYVEAGVACEACHGPGSVHAAWHEQKRGEEGYAPPARLVDFAELDGPGVEASCNRCHHSHEWRYALPDDPRVRYAEVAVSTNRDGPGFLADGRLAGLGHHGTTLSQSACATRGGISCLSCHTVHGEGATAPGDDARCAACHDAARYAAREHAFHEAKDARCVDCHMPRLLEAPLDLLRDHSLRSPDPRLAERFGAPDACVACHRDKGAAWAREWKEKWHGPPKPAAERLLANVATVVALRADPAGVPSASLAAMLRDRENPIFFRATALDRLGGRADPEARSAVLDTLGATEPDLLHLACAELAAAPDPAAASALAALLDHPLRTVRVEAAHALARAGWRSERPEPRLRDDVMALFARQYPSTAILVRAAWILDAIGRSAEVNALVPPLMQRSTAEAAPVVHRHGRSLAGAGLHKEALMLYEQAHTLYGEAAPPLLRVDSADSLAATGDLEHATALWREAAAQPEPASIAQEIAKARLLGGEQGRALLEPIAARLSGDLLGADMLRRVRWSLDALR